MLSISTRRIILAAYLGLILYATLAPISASWYKTVSALDKLAHVGLFAGMSFLMVLSMTDGWRRALWAIALTSALAAIIELVQGALPYRSAEWWDLWAGVGGAAVGTLAAILLDVKARSHPRRSRATHPPAAHSAAPLDESDN
ncbi:MAG: VanZ family protein [Gemmatimonadota bacterium]|nr:MAG: VanZ family protein [Gemmatimonadota bacterium]